MTDTPKAPAEHPCYQGEWDVEIPGAPDALEMLREAANDPETTDDEFGSLLNHVFRAGFFPDRLVRPGEPGAYTRSGIEYILGIGGPEDIRDILRDEPRKPRNDETPATSRPAPEPEQPQAVTVAAEDADDDDEEDTGNCPLCGIKDCPDHLLACFDVTFADQGEGNYGVGLTSGSLYDVDEIGAVLDLARLAWVRSVRATGKPTPPPWITEAPGLSGYFDALGDSGGFDIAAHEDDDDAANELAGYTDYHSTRAREFLEEALIACGWSGDSTHDHDDVFLASSSYKLWWDEDPKERAKALQALLERILAEAASTPPRPSTEGHSERGSPNGGSDTGAAPGALTIQGASADGYQHRCPVCQRPSDECRDHLLAWHLYPSGGNGLEGQLADEEIEALLGAVRLAWIRSVRAKESQGPVPPSWISEEPALRDYFLALGPLRDLNLDDEEPDEEAADRLRDLPWDHSSLVRDFLVKVLPGCGWEGLATEVPSEPDEETGLECLGTIQLWSADPKEVTQKLSATVRTMLTKARSASGRAQQ